MAKSKVQVVLVTALLLLVSGVTAQNVDSENQQDTVESELGEDVIAHNFVMQGLPASNQEEIEAERSFETEPDSNESFNISEDDALDIALEELGSNEWNLEETEEEDGIYKFSFVRDESEAEVSVDGSSSQIVEFEAEIEWEPENEEPSAVLSGFIQFSREGYEVDTDIEVDEESNEALFEVEIEQDEESGAKAVTREEIREFEDAAPGNYTGTLEVIRNDEIVHTEEQEFNVPGPVENETDSESEENESEESEETESEQNLENMSREELIEEVRSLREQVQSLQERANSQTPDSSDDSESDENNNSTEEESDEQEEVTEPEEESEESEQSSETPGNSTQRPGFVSRMLSGIFG